MCGMMYGERPRVPFSVVSCRSSLLVTKALSPRGAGTLSQEPYLMLRHLTRHRTQLKRGDLTKAIFQLLPSPGVYMTTPATFCVRLTRSSCLAATDSRCPSSRGASGSERLNPVGRSVASSSSSSRPAPASASPAPAQAARAEASAYQVFDA